MTNALKDQELCFGLVKIPTQESEVPDHHVRYAASPITVAKLTKNGGRKKREKKEKRKENSKNQKQIKGDDKKEIPILQACRDKIEHSMPMSHVVLQ